MNQGFPGTYSRNGSNITRAYQVLSTDSAGPAFGRAVVLNPSNTGGTVSDAAVSVANGHVPVMTQGANYQFVGIAVREVLTQLATTYPAAPTLPAVQTYAPGQMCDVLEWGAISVIVKDQQSIGFAAGAKVYLRTVLNGTYPTALVGDFETAADGGNTIQLTNVFLSTGVVDANNVTEVTLLSRNAP